MVIYFVYFFFFFQAEDGIRDFHVTGVQTCALPISHRVATGHTADDQAETVLMRLLQGTGPRGLAGIAPARGPLIRPLLETRRLEIERHLRQRGLDWVEDPSNRDPRFLRNRIRHEILPLLGEVWGPEIIDSLCLSASCSPSPISAPCPTSSPFRCCCSPHPSSARRGHCAAPPSARCGGS